MRLPLDTITSPACTRHQSCYNLNIPIGVAWDAYWSPPTEAAPSIDPARRGEPMAGVQEIRQRLRGQRIETLRSLIEPLRAARLGAEVWLFGSLARGDWDARSDGDL